MKCSQVIGIILAVALIVFGVVFPTPEKPLLVIGYSDRTWSDEWGTKYVGGDAYNYQIEASLKAGYMGGVLAMKSITFVGGLLLFFLTLYSRVKCAAIEEQTRKLSECADNTTKYGKLLEKISESADEQKAVLTVLSDNLDKHFFLNEENNVEEETV